MNVNDVVVELSVSSSKSFLQEMIKEEGSCQEIRMSNLCLRTINLEALDIFIIGRSWKIQRDDSNFVSIAGKCLCQTKNVTSDSSNDSRWKFPRQKTDFRKLHFLLASNDLELAQSCIDNIDEVLT